MFYSLLERRITQYICKFLLNFTVHGYKDVLQSFWYIWYVWKCSLNISAGRHQSRIYTLYAVFTVTFPLSDLFPTHFSAFIYMASVLLPDIHTLLWIRNSGHFLHSVINRSSLSVENEPQLAATKLKSYNNWNKCNIHASLAPSVKAGLFN